MTQNQQRTGPYIHPLEMCSDISFPSSGSRERSFTVLVASQNISRPDDLDAQGIAILDNDNGRVVVDGIRPVRNMTPDDPAAAMVLEMVCSMSWASFSKMCRRSDRYRGGIPNIDANLDTPLPGNPDRFTSKTPIFHPSADNRTGIMREMHLDKSTPYRLPSRTYAKMVDDIVEQAKRFSEGYGLFWNLTPASGWNRTGRVANGPEIQEDFNEDWRREVSESPNMTNQAVLEFARPYLEQPSEIAGLGPEATCGFEIILGGRRPVLKMQSINGHNLAADTEIEFLDKLSMLTKSEIAHLWASQRVMQGELSDEVLRESLPLYMADLRVALERDILEKDREDMLMGG